MILNTKYHDIREIVSKKLEEFFNSLDHLESVDENRNNNENHKENNEDVNMLDISKLNENGDASNKTLNTKISNDLKENKIIYTSKIYLSTSQIMTKILLGKKKKFNFAFFIKKF